MKTVRGDDLIKRVLKIWNETASTGNLIDLYEDNLEGKILVDEKELREEIERLEQEESYPMHKGIRKALIYEFKEILGE